MSDAAIKAATSRLLSEVFFMTQPNRGDVFSWLDDHAAKLVEMIAETLDIEGWQPIETAPKDGESILLYKPDEPRVGEYILAGYWGEWPGKGECWIACGGGPLGYFSPSMNARQGDPMRWRPLPTAPKGVWAPTA